MILRRFLAAQRAHHMRAFLVLILTAAVFIPAFAQDEATVLNEASRIARRLPGDAANGSLDADLRALNERQSVLANGNWSEGRDQIIVALVEASSAHAPGNACLRSDALALATSIAANASTIPSGQPAGPSAAAIRHHIAAVFRVAREPFQRSCHIISQDDITTASKLTATLSSFVDTVASSPESPSQLIFNSEFYRLLEALIGRERAAKAAELIGDVVARHESFPIDSLPSAETTAKYIQIALLTGTGTVVRQLADRLANADVSHLKSLSDEDFRAEISLIYSTTVLLDMKGLPEQARKIAGLFERGDFDHSGARTIGGSEFAFANAASFACRGDWQDAAPHLEASARLAEKGGDGVVALRAIAFANLEHERGSDDAARLAAAQDALEKISKLTWPNPVGRLDRMRAIIILAYEYLRQRHMSDAAKAFEAAIATAAGADDNVFGMPFNRLEVARILLGAGALDQASDLLKTLEPDIPAHQGADGSGLANPAWYELQAMKLDILMQRGQDADAQKLLYEVAQNSRFFLLDPAIHMLAPLDLPLAFLRDDPTNNRDEMPIDDDIANGIPLYRLSSFIGALLTPGEPLADDRKNTLFGLVQYASATQVEQAFSLTASRSLPMDPSVRDLFVKLVKNIEAQQIARLQSATNSSGIGGLPYDGAPLFSSPCSQMIAQYWSVATSRYLARLRHGGEEKTPDRPALLQAERDIETALMAKGINPGSALGYVPVDLTDFRRSLLAAGPHAAVIQYTLFPQYTLATVITQSDLHFIRLQISRPDLTDLIKRVLASAASPLKPFDLDADDRLSAVLLTPVLPYLAGIDHFVVTPGGPLESLPFGLLRDPTRHDAKSTEPDQSWLIDRFAISVMPGMDAIVALGDLPSGTVAGHKQRRFIGFGAPHLDGQDPQCETVLDPGLEISNGLANVDQLRELCPVWSLEGSLVKLAVAFNGANTGGVYVGDNATVTRVKQMNASGQLGGASILAFATHGNLATRLDGSRGYAPPGLILTPPTVATEQDDGYLTTTEIDRLNLNADWVLLTACDTATSDGTPGAEALSGIAKAFMFAGARAVLVSHWSVDKDASGDLVVQAATNSLAQSRPDALRAAMRALKSNPEYRHPYYWAPFTDVGM